MRDLKIQTCLNRNAMCTFQNLSNILVYIKESPVYIALNF
jgi:hypothetical protein